VLGLLAILILLVAALGGAYLLSRKGLAANQNGTPTPGPKVTAQPVPKAWADVLRQIKPDGKVSVSTALQAFSLVIGPLPQVKLPEQLDRPVLDGSIAVRMLVAHWNELTPAQQQIASQYLHIGSSAQGQASVGGASDALARPAATPIPDDPGTGPYRKIVEEIIGKLSADLKHSLSISTQISWKFNPKLVKEADAYVYPVNANGQTTGKPALCPIFLNKPAITQLSDYDLRLALAHEVMHCFQADIIDNLDVSYAKPGWIIEGGATWVGYHYADQISGASENYSGFWGEWIFDPLVPLFQRSYDAIGYYALLDKLGVSPWDVFTPMLLAKDNKSAYEAGASRLGDPLIDQWASSNERDASLGTPWELPGPGLSRITFQTPITPISLGSGDVESLNTPALAGLNYHLTSQADLIEVNVTGHNRLVDSGGVQVLNETDKVYCTKSGGCTCPSNSLYPGPEPEQLTGLIHLAVSGGTDGAKGWVAGLSLDDFCNKDIPGMLRRARPHDGTFDIIYNSTQAVIGNGVATRIPDLFYFKEQIDPNNPKGGYYEEVIDFVNNLLYFRIVGSPTWSVKSAHIAHWFDMINPKVVGKETINGVKTYHIRGPVTSGGHTWDQDVWVRVDNLYPVQVLTELTGSGTKYLLVMTAYNTGATITIPTNLGSGLGG
jgi:hypothetical protein